MAGTSAPPVPHCRDLTPVGERLASRLYTAHSDRLDRPVTVTVFPALADDGVRRRFDDAAATAQRLAAHPNVLTIYDWGHSADGRPWVVTDPQPPETIDTLVRIDGPLPVEQALRIGVLVAGAVETAHRAGIVHGDLSPARLVLGPQGEPLVADIGLAEFSDFPGFGALHYPIRYFAPPEVLERTGVSAASDIYSLAATVYALLAGSAPHEKPPDVTDSNASLLLRILQIEVPPIVRPDGDIDGVEAALGPALSHAPDKRPLQALDLARSLQGVQRNLGLAVVEPEVLDVATAERSSMQPPAAPPVPVAPRSAAPVPPDPDALPGSYTESLPNLTGTSGTDPVRPFSDSPPDFTHRSRGAAGHWATGLGRQAGPSPDDYDDQAGEGRPRRTDEPHQPDDPHRPHGPHLPAAATGAWAPTNGYRPNGRTPDPLTGVPPAGVNGRGNGLRPAPMSGDDHDQGPVQRPPIDIARPRDAGGRRARLPEAPRGSESPHSVPGLHTPVDADTAPTARGSSAAPPLGPRRRAPGEQATRPDQPSGTGRRRSLTGPETPGTGAFPAAQRTRTGSALDRARQARMRRPARSGTGEPEPGQRAVEAPGVKAATSGPGGAPAVPVIVLIVVVVLLTLGVAYMVITGDGASDPVEDQPGASTPSVPLSVDEA
jgi:serine/threonine protein kinase